MNREDYLNERYKILSKDDFSNIVHPVTFTPTPVQEDFDKGFIQRAFAKKINDTPIIEIDPKQVNIISSEYYKSISMNWKITGPRNNKYGKNNVLDQVGVEEYNQKEILKAEEELMGIKNKLTNPLQFWRGQ